MRGKKSKDIKSKGAANRPEIIVKINAENEKQDIE
jgi:hypothetical protein